MEAVQSTVRPRSTVYTLTYHMLWSCPLLAFAFGSIHFYLYAFGLYFNWPLIVDTVGIPVALTVVALFVNLFIEVKHRPHRTKKA